MIKPNDTIKVKLNENGLRIRKENFEITKSYYPNHPFNFEHLYEIDADNYWTTLLWKFLYEIGPYSNASNAMPFESIEKVFIHPEGVSS